MDLSKSELGIIFDALGHEVVMREIDGRDEYSEKARAIWKRVRDELFYSNRLTPVTPDRAQAREGDIDDDTRAAGEHGG